MGRLVLGADVGLDLDDPAGAVVAHEARADEGSSRIERGGGQEPPVDGSGRQASVTRTGS
jgi:hypothetical protein